MAFFIKKRPLYPPALLLLTPFMFFIANDRVEIPFRYGSNIELDLPTLKEFLASDRKKVVDSPLFISAIM